MVVQNQKGGERMDSILKKVGTMQVIYTVEPDPKDDAKGIMTIWTPDGVKIGSTSIRLEKPDEQ